MEISKPVMIIVSRQQLFTEQSEVSWRHRTNFRMSTLFSTENFTRIFTNLNSVEQKKDFLKKVSKYYSLNSGKTIMAKHNFAVESKEILVSKASSMSVLHVFRSKTAYHI